MTTLQTYLVDYLINEANSLHERLHMVKPFTMTMPMVRGASVSGEAFKGITMLIENGKNELHKAVLDFIKMAKSNADNPDASSLQKKIHPAKVAV